MIIERHFITNQLLYACVWLNFGQSVGIIMQKEHVLDIILIYIVVYISYILNTSNLCAQSCAYVKRIKFGKQTMIQQVYPWYYNFLHKISCITFQLHGRLQMRRIHKTCCSLQGSNNFISKLSFHEETLLFQLVLIKFIINRY